MLARYESTLAKRDLIGVRLCRADVLDLEQLPSTGSGYDLIVSTSMLEYVPRGALPTVLSALRAHLADRGRFVLCVT